MDLLEPLAVSFDHTTKTLAGVRADQLDGPTPCAEWDLRTLVGHVMAVATNMGHAARGEPLEPKLGDAPSPDDLAEAFRAVSDATLAAWAACDPGGVVDFGAGPMPVPIALAINLLDTTTHCWDVARASGQDASLPDDLAATVLGVCQGAVAEVIRPPRFGPAIAVGGDARPTDRLVAFLGRRP